MFMVDVSQLHDAISVVGVITEGEFTTALSDHSASRNKSRAASTQENGSPFKRWIV